MAFISVFDVIGPNMVGPSSSHTAGAASIALLAKKMIGEKITKITFTLYGSFAKTYKGHGTDKALVGGILGFETDDIRIRDSFNIARESGLEFEFVCNHEELEDVHPNTVDMEITGESGRILKVRGESLGGGKVMLTRINGVKVQFTGEYHALIVIQRDNPGVVAGITSVLSSWDVNIAYLRVFREEKGGLAYTIVESDEEISEKAVEVIKKNPAIQDIMLVQR
ncbi:MAG: L-serine ammonia-lyase, iron-sulfur-dependent subunit beta [Clostridia bacterium]|nr:L-serine ammonia-lyase, iron-sulfur-dependent subunit beta [Clostridia bacterium]MBQ6932422.1 L-serine ammonia-lyase, iron-sulfur-dependent subunit beta [Clostridia bacterium]MBQ7101942.1 L-serine ammonia-lyase, iron-sulfur-dependent subunit beta [Clostridia bacterium]